MDMSAQPHPPNMTTLSTSHQQSTTNIGSNGPVAGHGPPSLPQMEIPPHTQINNVNGVVNGNNTPNSADACLRIVRELMCHRQSGKHIFYKLKQQTRSMWNRVIQMLLLESVARL